MSEWVSVEDRLPIPTNISKLTGDLFTEVMVYSAGANYIAMYYGKDGFHIPRIIDESQESEDLHCLLIDRITHWMPLPHAPGKNNED